MAKRNKLTHEMAAEIRTLYREGIEQAELATRFGVSQPNVSAVILGRTWRVPGIEPAPPKWIRKGIGANAKITREQARDIRRKYAEGHRPAQLSAEYGVSQGAVSRIVNRLSWRDVP